MKSSQTLIVVPEGFRPILFIALGMGLFASALTAWGIYSGQSSTAELWIQAGVLLGIMSLLLASKPRLSLLLGCLCGCSSLVYLFLYITRR